MQLYGFTLLKVICVNPCHATYFTIAWLEMATVHTRKKSVCIEPRTGPSSHTHRWPSLRLRKKNLSHPLFRSLGGTWINTTNSVCSLASARSLLWMQMYKCSQIAFARSHPLARFLGVTCINAHKSRLLARIRSLASLESLV